MRIHFPHEIYFVTNRCEEERFFLLPKPNIKRLIGAWLGKALKEHGDGIELYAFVFLSNHLHLLLKDTKSQLAEFMWYFQLNLAKAVNRELGRRGHFFSREYDAAPVLTDEAFEERYAYILTNPVKPGLVAKVSDSPFFSSLKGALEDKLFKFTWFDRTRKHNRTRRGQKRDNSEFEKEYEYKLAIPPMWKHLSKKKRQERAKELIRANEVRYARERRAESRSVLGARRVVAQSPFTRPRNPARSPRVKVFCRVKEIEEGYLKGVRVIVGMYKEAYGGFITAARRGCRPLVEWPSGCYPPSSMVPIPVR
ncbi:MAG: hypothetical protein GY847_05740 [Proteobacteria bacterium]|nr:hypothetical protein [Pseudomonadota bacterium]